MNNKSDKDVENVGFKPKLLHKRDEIYLFVILFLFISVSFTKIQEIAFKIININKGLCINNIANMKEARSFHNASFFSDNEILITGGYDNKKGIGLNTTEILNIDTNCIKEGPSMNLEHYGHAQIRTQKGDIYIIDTNGIEVLQKDNPTKFQKIYNKLPNYIKKDNKLNTFSALLLDNDNILILGGIDNKNDYNNFSLLIDTNSQNIKILPSFTRNRSYFSFLPLQNSKILLVGGVDVKEKKAGERYFNDIEYFDYENIGFKKNINLQIQAFLPFIFYENYLNEIIVLYTNNNMKNEIIIIDDETFKVKKSRILEKNVFDSKINSYVFKTYNKNYLSLFFEKEKQNYKINSYISIFDKNGIKKTYNTFIQPYCAIVQKDESNFFIIGGEKIENNHKFNYFLKLFRGIFTVNPSENGTKIPQLSLASKKIYLLKIER